MPGLALAAQAVEQEIEQLAGAEQRRRYHGVVFDGLLSGDKETAQDPLA